jgi:predicted amidohydrolase
MTRIVKGGLIQCRNPVNDESRPVKEIQAAALEKHLPFVDQAGREKVQLLCLQEIFNGPYFCPSQDARWYDAAEPVPGPTVEALVPYARKYQMVMVIPVYEREQAGVTTPPPSTPTRSLAGTARTTCLTGLLNAPPGIWHPFQTAYGRSMSHLPDRHS